MLPVSSGTIDSINWGDGNTSSTPIQPYMTHIYPISTTEVTIMVNGTNLFLTNKSALSLDSLNSAPYLLECISWDNVVSLEYAFLGCSSLTSVPDYLPTSATNFNSNFNQRL